MKQLLIVGTQILAAGYFFDDADELRVYLDPEKMQCDAIYPHHVMEGYVIAEVELPDDFTCAGYEWQGGLVKKLEVVAPPEVPQSITRRQGLQQLHIEGFTEADIETNILALQITALDKDLALIEFRTSQEWQRNRPLVATMIAMLGKDASWGDAMFIAANKL